VTAGTPTSTPRFRCKHPFGVLTLLEQPLWPGGTRLGLTLEADGHEYLAQVDVINGAVKVQDLVGSAWGADRRGTGAGTVLVNAAIAYLQAHEIFAHLPITGELVGIADKPGQAGDRERFARSFGADPRGARQQFSLAVRDLRQVDTRARIPAGRHLRVEWSTFRSSPPDAPAHSPAGKPGC
jgi:hypothetical protein